MEFECNGSKEEEEEGMQAPELRGEYQALYDKATFAKETAKNKKDAADTKMFQFYANLLSSDAKYVWD